MADQRTPVTYSLNKEKNMPDEEAPTPQIGFIIPNAPNPEQIVPSSAPPAYETPPAYNPTYPPGQSVSYQGGRRRVMTWIPYNSASRKKRAIIIGAVVFAFVLVSVVMVAVFISQKNQAKVEFKEQRN